MNQFHPSIPDRPFKESEISPSHRFILLASHFYSGGWAYTVSSSFYTQIAVQIQSMDLHKILGAIWFYQYDFLNTYYLMVIIVIKSWKRFPFGPQFVI